MKKLLVILLSASLVYAFQTMDIYVIGKYTCGTNPSAALEMKSDHTFKETRGQDWRTGMWKLRHDSLIIEEGLSHHNTPHVNYPYQVFFLFKKEGIQIGSEMFRKEKPTAGKK